MLNNENIRRLVSISNHALENNLAPEEYIQKIIRDSVELENPLIRSNDSYFVIGIDGFSGEIFPCNSFQKEENAHVFAKQRADQEPYYSTGDEISTTFHVFTAAGIHINKDVNSESV
jgi:hypothetical protein